MLTQHCKFGFFFQQYSYVVVVCSKKINKNKMLIFPLWLYHSRYWFNEIQLKNFLNKKKELLQKPPRQHWRQLSTPVTNFYAISRERESWQCYYTYYIAVKLVQCYLGCVCVCMWFDWNLAPGQKNEIPPPISCKTGWMTQRNNCSSLELFWLDSSLYIQTHELGSKWVVMQCQLLEPAAAAAARTL